MRCFSKAHRVSKLAEVSKLISKSEPLKVRDIFTVPGYECGVEQSITPIGMHDYIVGADLSPIPPTRVGPDIVYWRLLDEWDRRESTYADLIREMGDYYQEGMFPARRRNRPRYDAEPEFDHANPEAQFVPRATGMDELD